MAKRGSYAKGITKREEILTSALQVIAREGLRGTSVRDIADAVGLSQAGLLHYFGSKEELFVQVLRKRDEIDAAHYDVAAERFDRVREGYLQVIRHNSDVPGVVELFSSLAVDAVDTDHPAHAYFLQRTELIRGLLRTTVRAEQEAGRITDEVDADIVARILQAVADGMQLQWLLDRDVDMAAAVEGLFRILSTSARPAGETSDRERVG